MERVLSTGLDLMLAHSQLAILRGCSQQHLSLIRVLKINLTFIRPEALSAAYKGNSRANMDLAKESVSFARFCGFFTQQAIEVEYTSHYIS